MASLAVFTSGYMIQSAWSAHDAQTLTPPGRIYAVPVREGLELRMHLYCYGDENDVTVLLEHGGGSNHVALLALADRLHSDYGSRVCLYDRPGYGFSPSLYTAEHEPWRLPNPGEILGRLLQAAGETGPYVCAGHSAGAEACLWFAHANGDADNVRGVAMMDGYPDLIHAGAFRPGQPPDTGILGTTRMYAFLAGATGLTRGIVGNPGPTFVPESSASTLASLYGQERFWFAQHWDLRGAFAMPEEERLYQQLQGYVDERGLYHYGGTLTGVQVLVLPAHSTVIPMDCDATPDDYCCGLAKDSDPWCQNQETDRAMFRAQADLYAATLGNDTVGSVRIAPEGAKHDFVYHRDYFRWVADQIGEQLLLNSTRQ